MLDVLLRLAQLDALVRAGSSARPPVGAKSGSKLPTAKAVASYRTPYLLIAEKASTRTA